MVSGSVAVGLALVAGACGGDPPIVTGPSGPNLPPVIQSLVAGSPQVEVTSDQTVQLTAMVTDAETSPTQLDYLWSVFPPNGTFTGSGSQVRWQAASAADPFTITLTVSENYASGSTLKENRTSSTAMVRFNETIITGLVSQFLTDFGTFAVTPEACIRNFSDLCQGKALELSDIRNNRKLFHIESATFNPANFVVTLHGTTADIDAPCTLKDNKGTTTGHCTLTAIYQTSKWFLCDSNYHENPLSSSVGRERDQIPDNLYRVP